MGSFSVTGALVLRDIEQKEKLHSPSCCLIPTKEIVFNLLEPAMHLHTLTFPRIFSLSRMTSHLPVPLPSECLAILKTLVPVTSSEESPPAG